MNIDLLRLSSTRRNKWNVGITVLQSLDYLGYVSTPSGVIRIASNAEPNALRIVKDNLTWILNVTNIERKDNNIMLISYVCNELQTLIANGVGSLLCSFTNDTSNTMINSGVPIQADKDVRKFLGTVLPKPVLCARLRTEYIPDYFENCGYSVATFRGAHLDSFINTLGSLLYGGSLASTIDLLFYAPVNNVAGNSFVSIPKPTDSGISYWDYGVQCEYLNLSSGVWQWGVPNPAKTSYLHYAPYTTMELYIPGVGTINVDPALDVDTVEVRVDYGGGTVFAYLISGGEVVSVVGGSALQSANFSYTDSNNLNYKYNIANNVISSISAGVMTGAGIVSGNPVMIAGGVTSQLKNQVEYERNDMMMSMPTNAKIGGTGGSTLAVNDRFRMTLTRPKPTVDVATYASSNGIPVCIWDPAINEGKLYRFNVLASALNIRHEGYAGVASILENGVIG